MNGKQKEYLKLKQEMALGDIEQAKKQIDLYLSDLSFKIDKLRQYFSVHGLCIDGDIREIHSITSELLEENNIIIKNNADYKTFKKMEALDMNKHIVIFESFKINRSGNKVYKISVLHCNDKGYRNATESIASKLNLRYRAGYIYIQDYKSCIKELFSDKFNDVEFVED